VLFNDQAGRVLRREQGGHVTHTLIANGEIIGSASDQGAPVADTFGSSYIPISDASLSSGPGSYTVQAGDTLQSIAKAMWGNAGLWYRLADANSVDTVSEGDVITIPARSTTVYNDHQTYEPYDPAQAVGDTTPNLPMPANGGGCGGVGQIVMLAVAIAVTAATGGAGGAIANFWSGALGSAGMAGTALTTATTVATGATAAAVGSIASQAVGVAIGAQDSFSWKGVALSAISGGVGAGVTSMATGALAGQTTSAIIGRAALGNVLTQGIGVATGLQDKFDWRGVAASAAGAGMGAAIGKELGLPVNGARPDGMQMGEFFGKTAAKAFGAGLTTAVMRGGKVAVQQVAVDAFGNALGSSLAEAMSPSNSLYGLASGDSGMGLRPGTGRGLGMSYAGARAVDAYASAGAGEGAFAPNLAPEVASQFLRDMGTQQSGADTDEIWLLAAGPSRTVSDAGNGYGPARRANAKPGPATATELSQQAQKLDKQAQQLANEAKRARDLGMTSAADAYQQEANKAYYGARSASLEAGELNSKSIGSLPAPSENYSLAPNWSYSGANSSGLASGILTDNRSQSEINASLDRFVIGLATTPIWVPAAYAAASFSPVGFGLGLGGDAAGQYYQNGTVRPGQSLFSGVTGAYAFTLAKALPAITTFGTGLSNIGGSGFIGGVTAVGNTTFNNQVYREETSLYDAGKLGAGFAGAGSVVGASLSRLLGSSLPNIAHIPVTGTPGFIPSQGKLNTFPNRFGNAVSNTIGAVPAFVPLDNGLNKPK